MRLTLTTVTTTTSEIEVPEVCPECGEPLAGGNLRAAYLRDEFHTLDDKGDSTGDTDLGDEFHLTAVWCRLCETLIAGA